jgi:hypothetical protein
LNERERGEDRTWADCCVPRQRMWSITCSIGRTRAGRCSRTTGTMPRVLGAGAGVCASLHATPGVLRHAQLLASRRLAAAGWRPVTMHELAHADPYATVASASPHGWERACDQGRFTSFPVETNAYHLTVCRDVERNPVRAGLVERAEQWCWSRAGTLGSVPLHEWPMARPAEWPDWVNEGETHAQWSAVRRSMTKGQPCGSPVWVE